MNQRFARDGPTASVRMGEVCPACFTETTENVLKKQPTPSKGLETACAMFSCVERWRGVYGAQSASMGALRGLVEEVAMRKTWEHGGNRPYLLAMQYLEAIGCSPFAGGKLTQQFFRVYRFFQRFDGTVLNLFHEFLLAHGKDEGLTMKAMFYEAPKWNQEQRVTAVEETKVEDYLALLKEW